jgi:hypothetical protein
MGSINLTLVDVVIDHINKFYLSQAKLASPGSWGSEEAAFLRFCLRNQVLTEDALAEKVHQRLLVLGRENFQQHLLTKMSLSSVISPQALAYALHHSVFSAHELSKIRFDLSNVTQSRFTGSRVENLCANIVRQLKGGRQKEVAS